jgi:hypothetical protein
VTFPWCIVFLLTLIIAIAKRQSADLFKSPDDWRLYCLLWMLSPLVFFSLSANIIWTYGLPAIPGFALLLADWLGRPRYQPVFALCVPLCFVGLVLVYQFSDSYFYRTQKPLVTAYQQTAQSDEHLHYFMDNPFSLQFYLHGKVEKLTDLAGLQNSLAAPGHDFYIFQADVFKDLPASVKARVDTVKNYGRFVLLHAQGND